MAGTDQANEGPVGDRRPVRARAAAVGAGTVSGRVVGIN